MKPQALSNDAAFEGSIQNGTGQLHPSKKITIHPVGARDKDIFFAIVAKVKEPTVLEKSTDGAAHTNILREALHTWSKHTGSAHDEINLHARLTCGIERLHHGQLHQRIHLRHDMGLSTGLRDQGLSANSLEHVCMEGEG